MAASTTGAALGAIVNTGGDMLTRRCRIPGYTGLSTRVLLLPPAVCSILSAGRNYVQGLRGSIQR
jgi:hypothetical protein